MTIYIFESMSASDAANFTSTDTLAFLSTGVSSLNVVDNAATALTTESITLSSGSQELTFSAAQLSAASLIDHLTFNTGDALLLGTSGAGDTLDLSAHSTSDTPNAEAWGFGGADTIHAGDSNDTINGGAGGDTITGQSNGVDGDGNLIENDYYLGGTGADTITGGIGNDHIYGNSVTSTAGATDGGDSLDGGAGNDYIQGNAGADVINGGTGAGNDRLYGGADGDTITGGDGYDYLQGNKGADSLDGGLLNDVVHGGADNDTLLGGSGNDQLFGDNGNDSVIGGAGFDQLTGGAGNDVFSFSAGDAGIGNLTSNATATNHGLTDAILDFQDATDHIQILLGTPAAPAHVLHGSAGATFTDSTAAEQYAQQLLTSSGVATDVAAVTVGSDTYLFYNDTGATTTINAAIKVLGLTDASFTTADFIA